MTTMEPRIQNTIPDTLDASNGVEVRSVSKCYHVATESVGRFSSFFINRLMSRTKLTELWALQDVSFDVGKGEMLGVLGTNGSGKSTLLRLLSGIATPTSGEIRRQPRVAALLDLSAGFHPTLTGYENIFLSGSILGISRNEIRELLPEIKQFSGLSHEYLDAPVRYYSSGMVARLGFALAVSCDPDVVLIDEVLAVGDAEFQARSARRLLQFREQGKAMILVSHIPTLVLELASKALWLHKGKTRALGSAAEVVKDYQKYLNTRIAQREHELGNAAENHDASPAPVAFSEIRLLNAAGESATRFTTHGVLQVRASIHVLHPPPAGSDLLISITHETGTVMDEFTLRERGMVLPVLEAGKNVEIEMRFDPLLLLRGHFAVGMALIADNDVETVYAHSKPEPFEVESSFADYPQHLVELPVELIKMDSHK